MLPAGIANSLIFLCIHQASVVTYPRGVLLVYQHNTCTTIVFYTPDSSVHGANMGPIWGRQDPGGLHVGPMNLAIWDSLQRLELPADILTLLFLTLPIRAFNGMKGISCWHWQVKGPVSMTLTHWGLDKMAAISQTPLSIAFPWMKMLEFWLNFHWSLFLRYN